MSLQKDLTTLVCLFHTQESAQAAMNDLRTANVPQSDITVIGGSDASGDALEKSELASLGMPDKDYDHLKSGLRDGGLVVSVTTEESRAGVIESIFAEHSAKKLDEATKRENGRYAATALPVAGAPIGSVEGETAVPVIEEELVVGKRTVDQGGVRVYQRVVEIPVEESVNLREEHVTMERRAADRAVTDSDLAFGDRTIELTETAEEAVVSKNARVVEEVLVGKTASEHVETIHDTVRRTEVEVEDLAATDTKTAKPQSN